MVKETFSSNYYEINARFSCTMQNLIEILGVKNFIFKSSTDRLKIHTSTPDTCRTLMHFHLERKSEYHTYQLQQDKTQSSSDSQFTPNNLNQLN